MFVTPLQWNESPRPELQGGAITVGNFDGVHLGHRSLVETASAWAKRIGGPTIAVTFDPPPQVILSPTANKIPLTTLAQRVDLLHQAGADHVAVLRTDAGLLSLDPEDFFEKVVCRLFGAKAVVEGYNFRFGKGRAGDTRRMQAMCESSGLGFEEVPPVMLGMEPISSSRVRTALIEGDVVGVELMLDRAYRIFGTVTRGAGRGNTIGFPTANLDSIPTLVPKEGVYAATTNVGGGVYPAAVNIGSNPTFGEFSRKVEVHILDFAGALYGCELVVDFVARLRDVKTFAGVIELKKQLDQDIAKTRELFDMRNHR